MTATAAGGRGRHVLRSMRLLDLWIGAEYTDVHPSGLILWLTAAQLPVLDLPVDPAARADGRRH
jgi:hypothetical protein